LIREVVTAFQAGPRGLDENGCSDPRQATVSERIKILARANASHFLEESVEFAPFGLAGRVLLCHGTQGVCSKPWQQWLIVAVGWSSATMRLNL
jgi:hypothetical protein